MGFYAQIDALKKSKRNRQVIGRIDKKCRESDNVRMTYVNDDSDG